MGYTSRWSPGDWIALCDSCGRKYKASSLQKRWDGLMVCDDDFEQRQTQDFVRGSIDKIAVPWSRTEPTDSYVPMQCTNNGVSAIPAQAVPGCMIPGYLSPSFNPSIP